MDRDDMAFFAKLSYLHKACIHPTDLKKAMDNHPQIFEELIQLYESVISPEELQHPQAYQFLPLHSAKLAVVSKMAKYLKDHHPQEKMVIVSNSVVLLNMVKYFFNNTLDVRVVTMDRKVRQSGSDV